MPSGRDQLTLAPSVGDAGAQSQARLTLGSRPDRSSREWRTRRLHPIRLRKLGRDGSAMPPSAASTAALAARIGSQLAIRSAPLAAQSRSAGPRVRMSRTLHRATPGRVGRRRYSSTRNEAVGSTASGSARARAPRESDGGIGIQPCTSSLTCGTNVTVTGGGFVLGAGSGGPAG
jgi:hypothetical protein